VVGPAAGLTEDVDILSLRAEPTWDSRNDLFNPTRGALARLQLERGLDLWVGELEFVRARASFAQVLPLNPRETTLLAAGLRAGVIVPTGGTEEIPLQERFFNGGESSVRSFEEGELGPLDPNGQPLGGETFTTLNLELRQKLSSSLWGGLFVDAGNVGPTTADFFGDYRYGVGVGLRYLLPVGALRVDFGWNPDQRPVDESYQVFLSVGMAF
jgi:outer membrane protein insertion porin family